MRVLLLSAYDALSHRRWREGLVAAFPEWEWTVLALPPRYFSWRLRGNSLTWAFAERATLLQPCDLLLATSMTDLSALQGLVPELAQVPSLVYCHENQFVYPERRERYGVEAHFTGLYTLLAADRVIFNSAYNRTTFLEGARALLGQMPDAVPPGVIEHLAAKSGSMPVPLESAWYSDSPKPCPAEAPFTLVWNHRWEYDKAPERLLTALLALKRAGVDFRVHVLGQQFRERPPVFAELRLLLQEHIGAWGMVVDTEEYRRLLRQSHVVVSTALHEFQGLAVLEAVASGCIPLVPDRLAYPEFIAADYRFASFPDDPERESAGLAQCLMELARQHRQGTLPSPSDVASLSWPRLRPAYAAEFKRLLGSGG